MLVVWPILGDCVNLQSGDWPHWRGAERTGAVAEASGWTGSRWIGPDALWTSNVGEGASSPLVVDAQVFTLGFQDDRDVVRSLDLKTGREHWSLSYPTKRYGRHATGDEGLYSGSSSTPEYDPQTRLLYTLGADGDLHCLDTTKRGAIVWKKNLYTEYRTEQRPRVGRSGRRDYGYTSSPLVWRDWLLVEVGSATGTVVAFDKQSGREAWRSQAVGFAGHTGGMSPLTIESVPCVAVLTFSGLLVVRLDAAHAGQTVAEYPWVTDFANNIAGTAVQGDCVLITSEYNHGNLCKLKITLRGAEKLWEQPYPSKACTPVIHRDRIYIAWDRLRCLDWQTGKLLWEGPAVHDAGSCVVAADEKLVTWSGQGDLFLADINPQAKPQYKELARLSRLAQSDVWPHVVLARGHVLAKDREGKIRCFALPGS